MRDGGRESHRERKFSSWSRVVMISIGYWNIHGTSDKLESDSVRDWIFLHDIVVLSETKTIASPSVPGYVAVNNSKSRRGGVAMLVRASFSRV